MEISETVISNLPEVYGYGKSKCGACGHIDSHMAFMSMTVTQVGRKRVRNYTLDKCPGCNFSYQIALYGEVAD